MEGVLFASATVDGLVVVFAVPRSRPFDAEGSPYRAGDGSGALRRTAASGFLWAA
jgi:hypothetical protein